MDVPEHIVSLVPSHTESLHDLGAADRVVGRTRFCVAPAPWVDGIAHVGGTKDADLDKILALTPDLVVADKDENPLALVEALQAAGIDVLWSDIDTIEDAAQFLETLGRRIGCGAAATAAARDIREALANTPAELTPCFVPIWYEPWMTFNNTSYPHAMLAAAGIRNVFADHDGPKYFEVADLDVAQSDAAHTLLPTEPFPFHKQRDRVATDHLGVAGAPERVHVIDGEALTWFGTRTARSIRELRTMAAQLL